MVALFVLFINIVAPGLGTILSAFLGAECDNVTVYIGIAQMFTTPIFGLGFIWGIVWSVRLYKESKSRPDEENPLLGADDEA